MRKIHLSISRQTLSLIEDQQIALQFMVSTALKGVGQLKNSFQTPLGEHYVRAKIGAAMPINSVFIARRPSGEIYNEQLAEDFPNRDWILSRILWLCGKEVGFNRLGNVDTMARYIYIHGTPDNQPMGVPMSHGCIRMRNADVIQLFDWAPIGCPVSIEA